MIMNMHIQLFSILNNFPSKKKTNKKLSYVMVFALS